MTDGMHILYRYIDHSFCEILPLNATVQTLASSLLRLKNWTYAEHALAYRMICET